MREPLYIFRRADLHEFLLSRATEAGALLVAERVVAFAAADRAPGARTWTLESVDADGARRTHAPFDYLIGADGGGGFGRRRRGGGMPSAGLAGASRYY